MSELSPVPMLLLHCPECGERHVDTGDFATKLHHTHACQACGMVWRPAIVPTLGVRFLPGFRSEQLDDSRHAHSTQESFLRLAILTGLFSIAVTALISGSLMSSEVSLVLQGVIAFITGILIAATYRGINHLASIHRRTPRKEFACKTTSGSSTTATNADGKSSGPQKTKKTNE